jgi:transcriptional regulator with XRE-family HTH domain
MRQSHISRLETGEVTPTLKTLKRYAKGLDKVIAFNVTTQDEYNKKCSFV